MPDTIRATSGSHCAEPPHSGLAALLTTLTLLTLARPALAGEQDALLTTSVITGLAPLERHEIAALALTIGAVVFAVVTAIALVRARVQSARAQASARREILALRDLADQAHALLLSEAQVVIAWTGEEPEILGDTSIVTAAPIPQRVLAFGTWLEADQALAMERCVEALRARGEPFTLALTTLAGRYLEADGRAVGGRAILRIRNLSGIRRELAELTVRHRNLRRDMDGLDKLIRRCRHRSGRAMPAGAWSSPIPPMPTRSMPATAPTRSRAIST